VLDSAQGAEPVAYYNPDDQYWIDNGGKVSVCGQMTPTFKKPLYTQPAAKVPESVIRKCEQAIEYASEIRGGCISGVREGQKRVRAILSTPQQSGAHSAEPVANNRKEFWKKLQSFVDDYIDGYEYCGEGDYAPNENEKFLIVDCVAGLLHELDSEGYFRAQPAKVPEFKFDEWWDQKARYIDHRSTKALARAAYKAGFGETYSGTTPQPADGGCLCQGCGNRYQFDVIVDDETWERIKPPKKAAGGGLLCPNCIANRVHQVGTGLWSAGYLSPIEQISPQPPREQEDYGHE